MAEITSVFLSGCKKLIEYFMSNLFAPILKLLQKICKYSLNYIKNNKDKFVQFLGKIFTGALILIVTTLLMVTLIVFSFVKILYKIISYNINLTLLIVFSLILLWGIFPYSQPFEGQLIVNKLSFNSTGPDMQFLEIENLKKITIVGEQKHILDGKFYSQTYPQLNKLEELEFQLTEKNSQWTLTSSKPKESGISTMKLALSANTDINDIKYNPSNNKISFSLNYKGDNRSKNSGYIRVTPNPRNKIKINLEKYKILNSKLYNLPFLDHNSPLVFDYKTTKFQINLPKSVTLYCGVEKANQLIFRSKMPVKNVKFETLVSNALENDLVESTIQSGTVRMAKQNLKLEAEQFINIKEPGISDIRRLKILPDEGLKVQVSGKTELIQIGLNPNLPVDQIGGNRFEQWFSRDFYIAIVTIFGLLIVQLISNLSK